MSGPTGVLLVNLGTPDRPEPADVRRYLQEFLSDPRVLDMHPLGRWALLNFVILPRRPAASAAAYRKIWTDAGSPLLTHTKDLACGVTNALGDGYKVEFAMRYGSPPIGEGLESLRKAGCDRIVVVPLYPQYASSSTGSTVECIYRIAGELWNTPFISVVPPFFEDTGFIGALGLVGRPVVDALAADHVLMSFHGLPERHMRKSDTTGTHCLVQDDCCDRIEYANRNCYRAQCFATARALAKQLELEDDAYSVSFQSRLGRDPWIRPYTDHVIPKLARRGIKRVAVFCPAFVADCLETLEEIGIRAREEFEAAGGEKLELVPCLNSHPAWVDAVVQLVLDAGGGRRSLPLAPV